MCEVSVSAGVRKNTGNYESVRFDVSLTLKGETNEDKERLFKEAQDWVGGKISDFVNTKT